MVGGKTYGYARVSSRDQNLDRQMNAFLEFGIDPSMVYADKMSGKDFCRPEYQRLLGDLCEGDVLVVKSIDRLGRSYEDILEQWRAITKERGASVVVLDMPLLDTRTQHEGVAAGTLKLVGTDEHVIEREFSRLLDDPGAYEVMSRASNPYGDGRASERIADVLAGM